MDELQAVFLLSRSQDPGEQGAAFARYTAVLDNPALPDLLFAILGDPETPAIDARFAARCLSDFSARHWEDFPPSARASLFQQMAGIVSAGHASAGAVSEAFLRLAGSDVECFEPPIFDLINRLPEIRDFDYCAAVLTLIQFLARKYRRRSPAGEACEATLLLRRIVYVTFPFYESIQFAAQSGAPKVLELSLKSFRPLFLRCKGSPDLLRAPIMFSKELIVNYHEIESDRLIVQCLKILTCLRTKWTKKPCAGECPAIAELLLGLLHHFCEVRYQNDYVVACALRVLCEFRKLVPTTPQLVDDLIWCACLTDQDCEDFAANPAVFHASVYSEWTSTELTHPRLLARHLLSQLVAESPELARSLLSKPVDECMLRCLGFFVPILRAFELIPALLTWLAPSIGYDSSPFETVAKIHLLAKSAAELPAELLPHLGAYVVGAITSGIVVLKIAGCALLAALLARGVPPSDETAGHVIRFLPDCPTAHAAEAITALARAAPALVVPRAAFVLESAVALLGPAAAELQADVAAPESAEDAVAADLALLAAVVRASQCLPDSVFAALEFLLGADFSEFEGVYQSLGALLREVFLAGGPAAPAVLGLLLTALGEHDHLRTFLNDLLPPIRALIAADPVAFLGLQASAGIMALCVKLLDSDVRREAVGAIFQLLANVGFVDESVASDCVALGASFEVGGDAALAALELAIAPFVGHHQPIDSALAAHAATAIQADVVRDPGQFRLFAAALPDLPPSEIADAERRLRALYPPEFPSVYERLLPPLG
jgi:hypothetical protein